MWPNPQFPVDIVKFMKKSLMENRCAVRSVIIDVNSNKTGFRKHFTLSAAYLGLAKLPLDIGDIF